MEKWPVWIRLKPKIWSERAFFVQKSANHLQGEAFLPGICSSLPEKAEGMATGARVRIKTCSAASALTSLGKTRRINMQEKNSGIGEKERIVEIEVERLREFRGHPFKVKPDDQMNMLMESIKKYGILNPLIVRPIPDGAYEIISGNRRRYAAQKLGYRKVPVIIRVLKDEEAVISMVDSNMHREVISPSEKAFACKMKYDAIKRKNGFSSNGQDDYQYKGRKSIEIMGEEMGESPKQVQRYLRIADLVPEILEMLDDGKIGFTPAYEASFLTEEEQKNLIQAMAYTQSSPSLSQAQRMKKLSRDGELDLQEMKKILGEVKKGEINRVTFKNEQLHRFFPKEYSAERMKERILDILKLWQAQQLGNTQSENEAE